MRNNFSLLYKMLRDDCLLKTEASFKAHKKSWSLTFESFFQILCADIEKAQAELIIPAISHLEFTMKYTNFIDRHYVAEVWVYGDDWYLDKNQCMIGEYDISFLFIHFDELWDKLDAQRKRYVGQVFSQEIKIIMIESLPKFYSYLTKFVRFAIVYCVNKNSFTKIVKNDEFYICVGDYMAKTEPVFTQKKKKNADKLADWFSERLEYDYICEDCADLDFAGQDFSNTIFQYAQFHRTILNNGNLQNCSLIGTSFYKAQLENCYFDYSAIFEADFSYANMKNVSLIAARGKVGLPDENVWWNVGFLPINFRGADLTGANLKWADLSGADFTCANLTNANFTRAALEGAIFPGAILEGANFTGTVLEGADLAAITQKVEEFGEPEPDEFAISGRICPKPECIQYFVMETPKGSLLPVMPKSDDMEIVVVSDSSRFRDVDYDMRSELISDRFKLLLEQYMPDYDFVPVVYYNKAKDEQIIYWRFRPPLYADYQAKFRNDGVISRVTFPIHKAPLVFTARSPRGIRSIVVVMAVAESALRRSILGLKFTKILELGEE